MVIIPFEKKIHTRNTSTTPSCAWETSEKKGPTLILDCMCRLMRIVNMLWSLGIRNEELAHVDCLACKMPSHYSTCVAW